MRRYTKDVAAAACVVARRDRPGKEGKELGVSVEPAALAAKVSGVLGEVQAGAYTRSHFSST